uniref:Uncharacterized protein n=1 Tax=Sphaerodactylus townsendi TaxID=933632 RepID=A0ACB8G4E5_9SAUR
MVGGTTNMEAASVLEDVGSTEEVSEAGSTDKTEVASEVGDEDKEEGGEDKPGVGMVAGVTDDTEVVSVDRGAKEAQGFMDKTEVAVVVRVTDEMENQVASLMAEREEPRGTPKTPTAEGNPNPENKELRAELRTLQRQLSGLAWSRRVHQRDSEQTTT